jgi:hypothetical protein
VVVAGLVTLFLLSPFSPLIPKELKEAKSAAKNFANLVTDGNFDSAVLLYPGLTYSKNANVEKPEVKDVTQDGDNYIATISYKVDGSEYASQLVMTPKDAPSTSKQGNDEPKFELDNFNITPIMHTPQTANPANDYRKLTEINEVSVIRNNKLVSSTGQSFSLPDGVVSFVFANNLSEYTCFVVTKNGALYYSKLNTSYSPENVFAWKLLDTGERKIKKLIEVPWNVMALADDNKVYYLNGMSDTNASVPIFKPLENMNLRGKMFPSWNDSISDVFGLDSTSGEYQFNLDPKLFVVKANGVLGDYNGCDQCGGTGFVPRIPVGSIASKKDNELMFNLEIPNAVSYISDITNEKIVLYSVNTNLGIDTDILDGSYAALTKSGEVYFRPFTTNYKNVEKSDSTVREFDATQDSYVNVDLKNPIKIDGLENIVQVEQQIALKNDGTVYEYNVSSSGKPLKDMKIETVKVESLKNIVEVYSKITGRALSPTSYFYALAADGAVYKSTGYNKQWTQVIKPE